MAGIGKIIDKLKALIPKYITFSGTVKVESSFAARVVVLHKEQTGELVGVTLSNPTTGVWSIVVCDNTNVKYYAVCIALSDTRNNEVIGHLSGIE